MHDHPHSSTPRPHHQTLLARTVSLAQPEHTATFVVQGMHCASCALIIERQLQRLPGVQEVRVHARTGKVDVRCTHVPPLHDLQQALEANGYCILPWEDQPGPVALSHLPHLRKRFRDLLEMGVIALVFVGLYQVFSRWQLIPERWSISAHMSYGVIFVIGLMASVSTCMAASSGLLLGLTTATNERPHSHWHKLLPAVWFNLGRILSYTTFGALAGALGSLFTLSGRLSGSLMIAASVVMLLLGMHLLKLLPWVRALQPGLPRGLARRLARVDGTVSHATAALVGASTFFLPCGFTQALLIYVLGQGKSGTGALTMLIFALGTLPALLSFGAVSSLVTGALQNYVVKAAGVLLLLISLLSLNNGLALAGISFSPPIPTSSRLQAPPRAPIIQGRQVVSMKVVGRDYIPSTFTVAQGIPVLWQVDGSQAEGCARVLTLPDLGISVALAAQGTTAVVFTPKERGSLPFRCPIAMTTAGATFFVLPQILTTGGDAKAKAALPIKTPPTCDRAQALSCPGQQDEHHVASSHAISSHLVFAASASWKRMQIRQQMQRTQPRARRLVVSGWSWRNPDASASSLFWPGLSDWLRWLFSSLLAPQPPVQ